MINSIIETKTENKTMYIEQFLEENKIPHIKVFVDVDAKASGAALKNGNEVKIPPGWTSWSYERCIGHNQLADPKTNVYNVNLKKGGFIVIDCDANDSIEPMLAKYGNNNISKSMSKRMPHIWMKRDPDDADKTSKSELHEKVDVLYDNVFEPFKNTIVTDGNISTFKDFKRGKNNKISPTIEIKQEIEKEDSFLDKIKSKDREILDNIKIKYWDTYGSWRNLMWAMYKEWDCHDICLHYSRKARPDVTMDDIVKVIESDKTKKMTLGTVYYLSKLSDESTYLKIVGKFQEIKVEATDNEMANLFLEHSFGDIVKHKGTLYLFDGKYWNKNRDGELKKKVHQTLKQIFKNKYDFVSKQGYVDDEDVMKKRTKSLNKILKMIAFVDSETKQNNVMNQIKMELDWVDVKMDCVKQHYFCFNNCAFNLNNGEIVTPQREDYISIRTEYDYKEPTELQKSTVVNFMEAILPIKDVRESVISVLRRGMYGEQDEKFVLFNGDGCNGKDTLMDLFRELVTVYLKPASCAIITKKQKKTGAEPELAGLDKARTIVYSEPDEGISLNGATIKEMSGTKQLTARHLYSSDTVITMMGISIMLCNQRPDINARADESILRRIVDLLFPVTFVSTPEEVINEFTVLKNTKFKDDSFRRKHKIALFDLLLKSEHRKVFEPPSVKARAAEFIYSGDNLMCWLRDLNKEKYEQDEVVRISDLHTHFKLDMMETMDKHQKEKWKKKSYFSDKLTKLPIIKPYYKKRFQKRIDGQKIEKREVLLHGWCDAVSPPLPQLD